jgi:hypothetical protein
MADVDDGSIADDHNILRRIRPDRKRSPTALLIGA